MRRNAPWSALFWPVWPRIPAATDGKYLRVPIRIGDRDALIVVDVQNDFLPGGALAVTEGDRIFEPLRRLMPLFRRVYATRDWHLKNHGGFQALGGPWPYHCLQDSPGA